MVTQILKSNRIRGYKRGTTNDEKPKPDVIDIDNEPAKQKVVTNNAQYKAKRLCE